MRIVSTILLLLAFFPVLRVQSEEKEPSPVYEIRHDFEYDLAVVNLQNYLENAGALLDLQQSELPDEKVFKSYRNSLVRYMKAKGYFVGENCSKIKYDFEFVDMYWKYVDLLEKKKKAEAAREVFNGMRQFVFKAIALISDAKEKETPVRYIFHTYAQCRLLYFLIQQTSVPWGKEDEARKKLINDIWEDLYSGSSCE